MYFDVLKRIALTPFTEENSKMAQAINSSAGITSAKTDSVSASYQAYQILRFAFTVAPIVVKDKVILGPAGGE